MYDLSLLNLIPRTRRQGCPEHALTYHSPGSVGYLGILSEAPNNRFDERVIVLVASTKQNLTDNVGGRVMEHKLRTQCLPCKKKTTTKN